MANVGALTMSVDVQSDRLEWRIKGWGAGEDSWLILTAAIPGDPDRVEVWKDLDQLRHHVNGGSVHGETSVSYTKACGFQLGNLADAMEAGTASSAAAARDRRDQLLGELAKLTRDAECLRQFAHLRIATLKLAERLHAAAAGDLERIEERIEEFDRESERLLAETGGEVKKQRALLSHMTAPGPKPGLPCTEEDVEALRAQLRASELADAARLRERAEGRRELCDAWQKAATTVLDSSLRVLALSEPDRLALEASSARAEQVRAELGELQRQIESAETTTQG